MDPIRPFRAASVLVVATLATSCGQPPPATPPPNPFLGNFVGPGSWTQTYTEPPSAPNTQESPAASATFAASASSDLVLQLGDGVPPALTRCSIEMSRSGDMATAVPGQTCTVQNDTGTASRTYTFTRVTATHSNMQVMLTLETSFTGMSGGMSNAGTFSFSMTGTRM